MSPKIAIASLIAPLLMAGPVGAQTSTKPTASAADAPMASAAAKSIDNQIAAYLESSPEPLAAKPGPEGAPAPDAPPPDRAVHGEAGFGIGTNGYREAYATMVAPIGQSGAAAVSVRDLQYNGRRGSRDRQSLSIALALGQGTSPSDPAQTCGRPDVRGGFEPLWATRLRTERPGATLACPSR